MYCRRNPEDGRKQIPISLNHSCHLVAHLSMYTCASQTFSLTVQIIEHLGYRVRFASTQTYCTVQGRKEGRKEYYIQDIIYSVYTTMLTSKQTPHDKLLSIKKSSSTSRTVGPITWQKPNIYTSRCFNLNCHWTSSEMFSCAAPQRLTSIEKIYKKHHYTICNKQLVLNELVPQLNISDCILEN